MNERLQQLASQAGHFEFNKWGYFDINKFAELIVLECAKTIEDVHSKELGDYLKKVFKVE